MSKFPERLYSFIETPIFYLFAKNDTAGISAQTKKQLAKLLSQIKEAIK